MRIFDRMLQPDRIKATAAAIKGKIAQVVSGLKTVDDVAEEEAREKEELREMAIKDQLTGAWNKHYMNAVLWHEMRSKERDITPLSAAFVDVDNFKNVNDSEKDKHLAGDRVLKSLKQILEETTGRGFDVGRWGGEEWLILGAGISLAEMKRIMLKAGSEVKSRLAREALLERQEVTVSAGVVEYRQGEEAREFIARADGAMYVAKEAGKNRMVVAGDTEEVIEFGS